MRAKNTLALAGLSCVLLAACSSTDSGGTAMSRSGENYSSTAGSGSSVTSTGSATQAGTTPTPASSDTGSMSATTTSGGGSDMSMDGSQSGVSIASATVQSIEPVPRGMDQASGEAQMGSSGTAGTTAGSAGNTMYRVTLRLDDGSTRAIMQNSAPTYQTGDRVKMVNGLVQRY
jgi:hypothetical protein